MVYEASSEVRNSIVFSTILVVLVFVPLFALSGMEGRLFTPLGVAYIVSILASLVVSLTVTPVLSYWLLPKAKVMGHDKDSFVLRWLKWLLGFAIRFSVRHPWPILGTVAAAVAVSCVVVSQLGRDFLPPFNEGSVQVNVLLPPGDSLETSNRIAGMVEERLKKIGGVVAFGRRTGRAELDEHAEGVNMSEIIVSFDPNSGRSREEVMADIREELTQVPGAVIAVEQPLQHVIAQMLSGVKAQIGIKLYGDDLDVLRAKANEMKAAIQGVPRREGPDGRAADRNPATAHRAGPKGAGLLRAELGRRERVRRNGHERPGGLGSRAWASGSSTCWCGSTTRSATIRRSCSG